MHCVKAAYIKKISVFLGFNFLPGWTASVPAPGKGELGGRLQRHFLEGVHL